MYTYTNYVIVYIYILAIISTNSIHVNIPKRSKDLKKV